MEINAKKILADAKIPTYAHEGDAGMDLYSSEGCTIKPGEIKGVKTGIAMEIPRGYAGLIWDKSGLAAKNSMHRFAGVIDAGYRGEIVVVLANFGKQEFEIKKHDKIAQMLVQKVERMEITETEELSGTSRGAGGFGSTGKN